MIVLFGIVLFLLIHTYFVYLLVLRWLRDSLGFEHMLRAHSLKEYPKVSLVVSAYNEESVIDAKIRNLLSLTYPKDKFEILIGSDGSRDTTNEKLKAHAHPSIRLFLFDENRGKAAVLNDLVQQANGDILVFCDMNTIFSPTAVEELVAGFDSPKVGAVNGRLLLLDSGKTVLGEGESLYWRIETEVKRLEADIDLLLGLNGAIYAIRKELYPVLPSHSKLVDDFYVCAKILESGYLSKFAPLALGVESTSKESLGEFKRKVRIGQANFNFLKSYLPLLHPKRPLLAFLFLSHKLLRWLAPYLLILLFVLNTLIVLSEPNFVVVGLMIAQIYFYASALLTHRFGRKLSLPGAGLAYYFSSMNLALLIGSYKAMMGQGSKGGGWERIARDE